MVCEDPTTLLNNPFIIVAHQDYPSTRPLSPSEISSVTRTLRDTFPNDKVVFRVITLAEPSKALLVPYLKAERPEKSLPTIPRKAFVQDYLGHRSQYHQLEVDITTGELLRQQALHGKHSYTELNEAQKSEAAFLADPRVQAELKLLDLPAEAEIVVEPWGYALDGHNDMSVRIITNANHFAYPLDICAQMSGDFVVQKVLNLPSGEGERMTEADGTGPKFDRRKILNHSEDHPDLQKDRRNTTKSYQVIQPEGPSFQISGNLINWEKWRFSVRFNYREGLTLHDITYEGRELFHRLSLSEMFVPYGDSRTPYPRKAAFDLGNNGAGVNANNLQLGCDCLGHIKYFDTWHHHMSTPVQPTY
ncbi:Copper amine oxidase [Penicillium malachiteum]|uniref:Copper amine oxidase n=1 Tax=Penicillium malachiteum TaxID=1324776 RepID=UPI002546D968|nr:Copper amine oxidase [Penicillium malachiteum]KAJ5720717.1 Copper amine oxidase [Penicillium malachiteum]